MISRDPLSRNIQRHVLNPSEISATYSTLLISMTVAGIATIPMPASVVTTTVVVSAGI